GLAVLRTFSTVRPCSSLTPVDRETPPCEVSVAPRKPPPGPSRDHSCTLQSTHEIEVRPPSARQECRRSRLQAAGTRTHRPRLFAFCLRAFSASHRRYDGSRSPGWPPDPVNWVGRSAA